MRVEPHLAGNGIVVVNLHHVREEPVAVLAQQLGDNHLEDSEGTSYGCIVNLQRVFRLGLTCSIHHFILLDSPAKATKEGRDEVRRGKIAIEGGVTQNLQGRNIVTVIILMAETVTDLRMLSSPQLFELCVCIFCDDATLQTFSIFPKYHATQGDKTLHEGRLVKELGDGHAVTDDDAVKLSITVLIYRTATLTGNKVTKQNGAQRTKALPEGRRIHEGVYDGSRTDLQAVQLSIAVFIEHATTCILLVIT